MLYVTTRNKNDVFTAQRTLRQDRGPEGGFFLPFRMPVFNCADIAGMKEKTFGQCVADILNILFAGKLNGWDVDFTIGRHPVELKSMSHKIIVGELWHNQGSKFSWIVENLSRSIASMQDAPAKPSDWCWVAVRIAAIFGLFGELQRQGVGDYDHPVDIAVCSGDFSAPMAAWYAREMGLPIGSIICSCNDNSAAWDLLHHGEMRTDAAAIETDTPEADAGVPSGLERLVFGALGPSETNIYLDACFRGGIYAPSVDNFERLRRGMFAAVVSKKRMSSVIHSVYSTSGYILDPYAALAYGGLLDYRASTGVSGPALILEEKSPLCAADVVSKAMGISQDVLRTRVIRD